MSKHTGTTGEQPDRSGEPGSLGRRDFLKSSVAGLAAGAVGITGLDALTRNVNAVEAAGGKELDISIRVDIPVVLRGGVVLTLDPAIGDFEQADVLIKDKKIVDVRPNLGNVGALEIDCSGMIVCPGFVSTHNHQYEAIQRAIISDGIIVFPGDSDQQKTSTTDPPGAVYEAYGTVVQSIWTAGRLGPADNPQWDIGRSPYDPEDCYNAELIASLSQLTQGITCGTDTSQSSHTPEHTDAMIEGLMAAGRRTLYDYSGGTNRDTTPPPVYKVPYGVPTRAYEFPGAALAPGAQLGIERIANKYFSSKDQLVTLGFSGGPAVIPNLPAPYTGMTGWQLGRTFGAFLNAHNVGGSGVPSQALAAGLAPFNDATLVHCVRWQDNPIAQISHSGLGYPNPATSNAMKIWADNGGHVSIAAAIEMQMRHGMPPLQLCLNHGVLPSLSPDVDTNMSPDPFTLMRAAFTCQRALANDLAFPISDPGSLPIPQLLTCKQVVEMMTVAGAAGSGLSGKVGTLTPGKEADIVCLQFDNINYQPMNNAYGTIVTMMDTRAVKHVFVAGRPKVLYGKLIGVNTGRVISNAIRSRENVLARINGLAQGFDTDIINRGKNSFGHPYRPAFVTSCCFNGQNEFAPQYVLRP